MARAMVRASYDPIAFSRVGRAWPTPKPMAMPHAIAPFFCQSSSFVRFSIDNVLSEAHRKKVREFPPADKIKRSKYRIRFALVALASSA
jgi:hypothetical protein